MTGKNVSPSEASSYLGKLLSRPQLSGFSIDDIWTMRFAETDIILAFHDFSCAKENMISQCLKKTDPTLFDCADPDDLAKSVVLSSLMRKEILSISVNQDAELTLIFEGNGPLTIRTDTGIVDWQWCVTRNAPNPYVEEAELACLRKGEISR